VLFHKNARIAKKLNDNGGFGRTTANMQKGRSFSKIENLGSFGLKILGILILYNIGPIGLIGTDVNLLTVNRPYCHRQSDNSAQRIPLLAFNRIPAVAFNRIPVKLVEFFGIRRLSCFLFFVAGFLNIFPGMGQKVGKSCIFADGGG